MYISRWKIGKDVVLTHFPTFLPPFQCYKFQENSFLIFFFLNVNVDAVH